MTQIQVVFNCPVGVVVETDSGEIKGVHVWDDALEFNRPIAAFVDEYRRDMPDLHPHGYAVYEEVSLDDPQAELAIMHATDPDAVFPAWQFGS